MISCDYLIQNMSFYKTGILFCKSKISAVANIAWKRNFQESYATDKLFSPSLLRHNIV